MDEKDSIIRFTIHNREPEPIMNIFTYENQTINTFNISSNRRQFVNEINIRNRRSGRTRRNSINRRTNNIGGMFELMNVATMLEPFNDRHITDNALQESLESYKNFEKKNINLTLSSVSYEDSGKEFESCAICQEDYEYNEKVSLTKCKHLFHTDCIKKWGCFKPECPMCKTDLPYEEYKID
jgi:hypothetical protein